MKKYLTIAIILLYLLPACSKKEGGSHLGNPVSDQELARVTFMKINNLWAVIKPKLSATKAIYTDYTLNGPISGTAVVAGTWSITKSSSSTSTRSSSIGDVTIDFREYETDGLKLTGKLRFYDSYSSRTACSSSGCASSTDTYISYASDNASNVAFAPLAIQFNHNDKKIGDSILLDANKQYSSFDVKIVNGEKKSFSFSY